MAKMFKVATALILGLLVATATAGRSVARTELPTAAELDAQISHDVWAAFFYAFAFLEPLRAEEEARKHAQKQQETVYAYVGAVHALRVGNKFAFDANRAALESMAADTQRAFSDLANARFARNLLGTLPGEYVPGFAFLFEDGTAAADPNSFVRHQLMRAGGFGPDGDGDGVD